MPKCGCIEKGKELGIFFPIAETLKVAGVTNDSEPSGSLDSAEWLELRELHPSRVTPDLESLYALPAALVEVIVALCPGLLTEDDLQFERDLARLGDSGFFRGRPFKYAAIAPATSDIETSELDAQAEESSMRIRAVLDEEMIAHGVSPALIQQDRDAVAEQKAIAVELQWGYAGWLATNQAFRQECRKLKEQTGSTGRWGQPLPSVPHTITGYSNSGSSEEYVRLWEPFYTSWSLGALVTWELPVPMRAELNTPSLYDYARLSNAGVKLFVPWYLSRYRQIDLNELIERQQRLVMPHALDDWFNARDGWGPRRYLSILRLYVYLQLAIQVRYSGLAKGKLAALDNVFAEYFSMLDGSSVTDETVRKLRLHLQSRLRD